MEQQIRKYDNLLLMGVIVDTAVRTLQRFKGLIKRAELEVDVVERRKQIEVRKCLAQKQIPSIYLQSRYVDDIRIL